MSTAMYDNVTANEHEMTNRNPTALRRGTLVFLWAPGETPWQGFRPITARVEKTTAHAIIGEDVRDGGRGIYTVGADVDARQRWSWEVCAPPAQGAPVAGIAHVIAERLTFEERIRLAMGDPGTTIRVELRSGNSVTGRLSTMLKCREDDWEAEWAELIGPLDSAGKQIVHWVRVADVISLTRTER